MDRYSVIIDGLTFGWNREPLFSGITAVLEPGDRVIIRGENGCGKTTLLKLVGGMIPHFGVGGILQGDILLNGRSIVRHPPKSFFPRIAFLPSGKSRFYLLNDTLEEEAALVEACRQLSAGNGDPSRDVLRSFFPELDLFWRKSFGEMSAYQIALSLMAVYFLQGATLFLMDEIVKSIPVEKMPQWLRFFEYLSRQGSTVILSSHDFSADGYTWWEIAQKRLVVS